MAASGDRGVTTGGSFCGGGASVQETVGNRIDSVDEGAAVAVEEWLAAIAAAVDTASESFSNSGSFSGKSIDRGHGTTDDDDDDEALEIERGGDDEDTPTSN